MLKLALRMLWRDWRSGELGFLLLALVIAVSALSSVGFFAERIRIGLQRDAHQLLAADLLVGSDRPLPDAWRSQAEAAGLTLADTVVFQSMAQNPAGASKLVTIKAVSSAYPLRGTLRLSQQVGNEGSPVRATPAPGTVWVDANLLGALNVKLGQSIQLGEQRFTITQIIASEPDRGALFMNFAPRVMMSLSELPRTQLVQPGARITYRLLVADQKVSNIGASVALNQFQTFIKDLIASKDTRGVWLEALDSARPEMRATLDRAERFLALVSLLSSLLAAVAIALASRRYMLRHLNACVMLRFLGMTQNQTTLMFMLEFGFLAVLGSGLGALLGYGAHFILLEWLGTLVATQLPAPTLMPAAKALATGMVLLFGFALPPLLQLRNVTLMRVIRRENDVPQALTVLSYLFGGAGFLGLLLWQAGEVKLGLMVGAGFLIGLAGFGAVAWLSLRALRLLRFGVKFPAWRFALNSLQRRPGATVVQIVALGLGLMALLLLTVVRGQLVDAWRNTTPPDAPNRFVINIQPDQKDAVADKLQQAGVDTSLLFPMIRGRLIRINGNPTSAGVYKEARIKNTLEREFNLSTMADLPAQNDIVEGVWYGKEAQAEASVESGLAKNLGLKLGDKLTFDIGGQIVDTTMSSVRKLDWSSMRVNFYIIISPPAMREMPQTWITAFHLPPEKLPLADQLSRDFPNLTVVDTGQILRQVQTVLDQVIAAVEFLFAFTLASGAMVLYAVLMGSQDERKREAGLLRALGATRLQLQRSQRVEFFFIGALAGLLAASGAAATGWALARFAFEFVWVWQPQVWLFGAAAGVVCAMGGGWLGLRSVLLHPPLQTLREG
jgi:putative ABC transport system permease protein